MNVIQRIDIFPLVIGTSSCLSLGTRTCTDIIKKAAKKATFYTSLVYDHLYLLEPQCGDPLTFV